MPFYKQLTDTEHIYLLILLYIVYIGERKKVQVVHGKAASLRKTE